MISYAIVQGVQQFFQLISLLVLVDVLISWFLPPTNAIRAFLDRFVQPIMSPFRPIGTYLARFGLPFDLTPIVTIFMLGIVENIVVRILLWLIRI